uniref:Uncharacterized protein n=1 Tax=Rhizophagus irregularis (strain DAOM 181602 / DAOM 197198 / MUCL 43194) TaxID=747089 RepID=U9SY05_RHIID
MYEDNNLIKDLVSLFRMGNFEMQHESLSAFAFCSNERDRINLFLIEFLDDNVAHQGDRAVKSRKEITWNVINQLIIAFDNLMDNSLFEDISELSNMTAEYTFEGRNRLFNFVIQ